MPSYISSFPFLSLSFSGMAEDGDDGTGWIFNRFVSGSTMGGGIVVNIITYRSLRLHFPRPCQTGAITHSSHPLPHMHTHTHTHTHSHSCLMAVCDSACLHHFAMAVSYDLFNPSCILLLNNLAFSLPHLHENMIPAWTDALYTSFWKDGGCFINANLYLCTVVWW